MLDVSHGVIRGIAIHDEALSVQCHRSEEHTSELQSQSNLVCRLLLEKKKSSRHAPVSQSLSQSTMAGGSDCDPGKLHHRESGGIHCTAETIRDNEENCPDACLLSTVH